MLVAAYIDPSVLEFVQHLVVIEVDRVSGHADLDSFLQTCSEKIVCHSWEQSPVGQDAKIRVREIFSHEMDEIVDLRMQQWFTTEQMDVSALLSYQLMKEQEVPFCFV